MLWVLDGRVGHAGGNSVRVGVCKYVQTSPELMLRALIHCWAHLAGVSGGGKMYSGSRIIIKIYPALSLAIVGWGRVDGGRRHWMTHSNYRTHHQLGVLGISFAPGLVVLGFSYKKNTVYS